MKYLVKIQETLSKTVDVEAVDPEQAIADIMIDYYECMHILDKQDLCAVNFTINESYSD